MMDFSDHLWNPQCSAEWWYFTGAGVSEELGTANFHVAFFRKYSKSFGKHFWFAHYGIAAQDKFWFWREFAPGRSTDTPHGCRIGSWELSFRNPGIVAMLRNGDVIINTPLKPPVGHDGNYYSITDTDVRGTLFGRGFRGKGWFDHAWFDASVQELLDLKYTWIALQLDAGIEIMVQRSSRDPKFLGTIVYPGGAYAAIKEEECNLIPNEKGWILELPKHGVKMPHDILIQKRVTNRVHGNPEPGYIEGILDFPGGRGYFEIAEGITKSLLNKSA